MKLVLLQTLCFALLWVGVAPKHGGAITHGLTQAEAQGPPHKGSLIKGLRSATFTVTTQDDSLYPGGGPDDYPPCKFYIGSYTTFKNKHVLEDTPKAEDNEEIWKTFLTKHKLCDRDVPIQSFLQYEDEDKIKNVCTAGGGKIYENNNHKNLCISNDAFNFRDVTVKDKCNNITITKQTKHIILACNMQNEPINNCMPVHFHGSKIYQNPEAQGCYYHRPASDPQ